MRKFFTLAAAIFASISLMADINYYTPTADEVIVLKDNTSHACITSLPTSTSTSYKCGDPDNNGAEQATASTTYCIKGNSGKVFKIAVAGCSDVIVYHNKHNSRHVHTTLTPSVGTATTQDGTNGTLFTSVTLDANKSYELWFQGWSDEASDLYVYAIKLIKGETCLSPVASLQLDVNVSEEADVFVGDQITFSTTGGNGGTITIAGAASEVITNNVWVATAGKHTFTASQAQNGDTCAQEATLDITVLEKTPVTAVTVSGPNAGFIGQELTFTATAANAMEYAWYVNDVPQGSDSTKLLYTPTAAGNLSIVCKARNDFNAAGVWIASDPIAVTVTKQIIDDADTYIWKKGSSYAGCVANPDVNANANQAVTELTYSTATFTGMSAMGRPSTANTEVTLKFAANQGLYIDSICTYGKLEESAGAQISWDEENWENIAAYSDGKKVFKAPVNTRPTSFTIKFLSVSTSSGGLWWRNALVAVKTIPDVTITYNANGGSGTMEPSINYVDSCTFTAPANKEFDVWNTAADGTGKTHYKGEYMTQDVTLYAIWRNAGAKNTNAKLSALSVTGYTLTPAFDADVLKYSITKAYSTAKPEVSVVTAIPQDPKAIGAEVTLDADTFLVTVTAEDNVTTLVYKITILTADAKKDLLEVAFSDSIHGFIANGNINVPYLAGNAEPTFVAAKFWNAEGEPTAEIVEGKLVVHGMDGKTAEYTVNYIPVTPMAFTADTVTFDTTVVERPNGYVYSVYGWDASKGIKFSKDVEEANNRRISEGKDRIYLALPAADSVMLYSGSAGGRPVTIFVNGQNAGIAKTAASGQAITLRLNNEAANFIGIESNNNNGDAGFTRMLLFKETEPSAIINVEADEKAVKFIQNGQLYILKNGILYNAQGIAVE